MVGAGLASVKVVVLGAAAFLGAAWVAAGQRNEDPDLLLASAGYFDVRRRRDAAAELRVGYRGRRPLWAFRPLGGLMATTSGAVFAYGGVAYDVFLFGRHAAVTPSFAPGLYARGGGLDLGGVVEFRSQVEVSYRFPGRSRLGVSLSHMSNAGLGRTNPGTESLMLDYSVSFGKRRGGE